MSSGSACNIITGSVVLKYLEYSYSIELSFLEKTRVKSWTLSKVIQHSQ